MTKIMPAEEWVDLVCKGMGLDPGMRKILAYLAPQPQWVSTAALKLLDRGIVGAPYDQAQEMWQEELAAAKAAAGETEH